MTDQQAPQIRLDGPSLILVAEAEGLAVSRSMLARLCAQGLLPRPARTGQRGLSPRWTYPPGTGAQLVALLPWRQQTKDPDVLRVALWLEGFAIPEAEVRPALGRRLRALQEGLEQELRAHARRRGLDLDTQPGRREALHSLAKVLAGQRGPAAIPRHSRMRAAERAHGLAQLLAVFGFGDPDAREGDGQAVERVLGVAPNGRRAHLGDAQPWLTGPAEALFDAAEVTGFPRLLQVVDDVTDAELATVGPLAAAFLQKLPFFVRFVDIFTGKTNTFGMAEVLRMSGNPESGVFVVPMFISMLREGGAWQENLYTVSRALEVVEGMKDGVERLLEMDSKVFTENLAAMPAAQREQIERIINAAMDGTLEAMPPTRTAGADLTSV